MVETIKMRWRAKLTVPVFGAFIYSLCMAAYAVEPQPGKGSQQTVIGYPQNVRFAAADQKTVNLKLDLGEAQGSEDCDDGPGNSVASNAPAVAPLPKPATAAVLSRLDQVGAFNTARAAVIDLPSSRESLPVQMAQNSVARTTLLADASSNTQSSLSVSASWDIVPADKTLNATLARWAAVAGWQLLWELPVDYAVETRTTVSGTFEEAVGMVAKSMETAEIPMKAIFYQGNKVLRIVAKGAE